MQLGSFDGFCNLVAVGSIDRVVEQLVCDSLRGGKAGAPVGDMLLHGS